VTAWEALLWLWLSLPPSRPYDPPPPPILTTDARRFITRPEWHLGIAGHSDGTGAAVTVRISWR
jgi:hypothetical protein